MPARLSSRPSRHLRTRLAFSPLGRQDAHTVAAPLATSDPNRQLDIGCLVKRGEAGRLLLRSCLAAALLARKAGGRHPPSAGSRLLVAKQIGPRDFGNGLS